jgi:alpha-glucuronidase
MPHIKRVIGLAAAQGVNRIQLSHNIVMDSEEILEKPQLVKDINEICKTAHAKGLKVDIWTHELNGVPKELQADGRANLEDPKLWEWMKEKYAKVFKLCPDVDGLVLTMHETAMSIYNDNRVASSIPPEKRVAKLVDNIAGVCKSFGKTLFVRTFSYSPNELQYISAGLRESKSDVIAMTKCQPHDWQPFYPHNPAIGNIGKHPQIMEFDLGYEFLGLSTIPYIDLDYLRYRLDYGLSKGIDGGVLRIERLRWRSTDTPNWADVEVFTKVLMDPQADQKELFRQWIASRYGSEAAPYVVSALNRTFDIVNKSYFVLGFWYTNHSIAPGFNYTNDRIGGWSNARWDPRKKTLEQALLNPTWATLKKIDADKDVAIGLARASVADIEKAKPYLSSRDYAELKDLMDRELAMAEVWKEHAHTCFAIRIAEMSGKPEDKAAAVESARNLEAVASRNMQHLVNMASDYGNKENKVNLGAVGAVVKRAQALAK